ncbi:hypothetical protein M5689_005577 [Euphorbia peplus]|nr:hypothetical protein M5689_005577 [Euphorbia peplus]
MRDSFKSSLDPAKTRPTTRLATELNGVLHWLVTQNNREIRILTFNLAERKLQKERLKVPAFVSGGIGGLFEHRGCLCLHFSPPNTTSKVIWIMEKYGDNNSWVQLFTVEYPDSHKSGFDLCYAPVVCITTRNEVVFRCYDGTFVRFDSKEGKFYNAIQVEPYVNSATLYAVDTLISPNDIKSDE